MAQRSAQYKALAKTKITSKEKKILAYNSTLYVQMFVYIIFTFYL